MCPLHLLSRAAFLQRKVKADEPEGDRVIPCRSAGILGSIRIHSMLVDEHRVLFCHRVTQQVRIYLQALR
jgi:hypothetical protein